MSPVEMPASTNQTNEHASATSDTNPSNLKFTPGEFCSDEPRRMKVVIIGAGFSGITAGIRFRQRVPNLDLSIYEANAGVGGTWFANRYPGIACDVAAHSVSVQNIQPALDRACLTRFAQYQVSYFNNPNWSAFYAPGAEIREYAVSIVEKYKLMPYIKLQHKLIRAEYNEEQGKWLLTFRRPKIATLPTGQHDASANGGSEHGYEEFVDTADVLYTGMGILSRWDWPKIEGLHEFQGRLVHSAKWETGEGDLSPTAKWEDTIPTWKNKKIAVIGVGSSAIQIVAALQPKVAQLTNFVRSKTWISATFSKGPLTALSKDENATNYSYTEEDKTRFADPKVYNEYRRELERDQHAVFAANWTQNPISEQARKLFKEDMIRRLAKKPWIVDLILPEFPVACKRLTPGPGYLEALCEDNVDFVPESIKRITPTGIETADGKHRDFDVIICATGRDMSFKLPFIGRNGVKLEEKFDPHPRTYLTIAVDGFPNWIMSGGPNSGLASGNLLMTLERIAEYAIQVTLKLQRERLKSIEVKKEAVDDFDEYMESYFPKTVFGQKCKSWYKGGKEEGRVVALFPGSSLLYAHALTYPRWEDYNYEPLDRGVKNRFYWLGDGSTKADTFPEVDSSWYLDPKVVDVPPVPE
ncbi:hypothetical protein D9758_009675 [Tetrapyrgos nigripes]|uniref:Flavin-containing monooxygenase n=1 Tax=Tetrapyrgos nigripes TaxID=182062 RepID=A0A8H5CQA6_9AGAR|nr:hypothetical protein D9758_009675 [Tetrapyrgos nigripes]